MTEPVRAILAVGSNLGSSAVTLSGAIGQLAVTEGITLAGHSDMYETVALRPDGPDETAPSFLNMVVAIETTLEPLELLAAVNYIEDINGRTREVHWGDRTLDIDIVTMGDLELTTEKLTLPHPEAAKRAFVLVPWLELDPDATLPGIGRIDALPAAHEDVPRFGAEDAS